MRRFYIVEHAPEHKVGNAVTLKSHDWGGFNYFQLMRGVPVETLPSGVKFFINETASDAAKANVLVVPFGWQIFSSQLAARLKAVAPNDVELVEVAVSSHDGTPLPKKFFAINALRVLGALSEAKSLRSSLALGDTRPVLKPAVISSKVPDEVHVFRLKGDEYSLLVDDVAKQALVALPHDGLTFISVETE